MTGCGESVGKEEDADPVDDVPPPVDASVTRMPFPSMYR
jgi:hypothetical protein